MLRRRMLYAVIGLAMALAIVLSMSTCNLFGVGTLTIRNYATADIDFVTWQSNNGRIYDFGDDTVWDYTINGGLGGWVYGIAALGGADTHDVDFGSDYIYFFWTDDAIGYRTKAEVDVNLFTDGSFTFYDTTAYYIATLRDGSTEARTFTYVPVPGMTKPAK
jgi:hypothetical protein